MCVCVCVCVCARMLYVHAMLKPLFQQFSGHFKKTGVVLYISVLVFGIQLTWCTALQTLTLVLSVCV